jgi:hypothetical protein
MHVFLSKYMSLKIEILNIPLLASCHVFDISEEVHSYIMNLRTNLDFANALFYPAGVNSRAELVPLSRA